MENEQIASELKSFFEREFPNAGVELTPTTRLLEDWFVDSLAIVTTTLFMEEHFKIDISRADINGDNFESISTLANLVHRRRQEQS